MATSTDFTPRRGEPFQFRLRTMLLAVTLCGASFALMQAIGPVGSVIFGFFMLLVALHVAGNAIGTRLRDDATAEAAIQSEDRPHYAILVPPRIHAKQLALRTPLGRCIAVLTALGVAVGGTLGEIFFFAQAARTALVVGTISSAVIGGFATFLVSSFLCVGASALWQAHRGHAGAEVTRDFS